MNNEINNDVQESTAVTPEAQAPVENVEPTNTRKKGIIKKFSELTFGALEKMRDDLSLRISTRELAKCQSVYRLLRRDAVSTDEIYFLDSFIESRRNLCAMLAPRELLTNDAYIAETYADIMDKCTELDIIGSSPISINLNMLLGVGSEYAKYAGRNGGYFTSDATGKYSSVIGWSAVPIAPALKNEPCTVRNSACELPCFINDGTFEESLTKRAKNKKSNIAFLLNNDGTLPSNEKINAFLSSQSCKKAFIGCGAVENSLTRALRKLCGHFGISINLDSLLELGISDMHEIEEGLAGLPLIYYSSNADTELKKAAEALGLKLVIFACTQKIFNLIIIKSGVTVFNIPWSYLSSLLPTKAMAAKINSKIFDPEHLDISSKTLNETSAEMGDTVEAHGKFFISSAYTKLDNGYFSTLYAILGAVSKLIAKGAALSDISVSYEMRADYPESEENFGELMSYILGAYRSHAELALVGSKCTLKLSGENDFLVFAFSNSKNAPISNELLALDKTYTYIAKPKLDKDGIVDFDSLRDIWRFISQSKHDILAARALCTERACDFINIPSDEKMPLAFIIQTAKAADIPHSSLVNSDNSL